MKQLDFCHYKRRFDEFSVFFDLAHDSLREFKNAGFRRFMKSQRKPKEDNFNAAISILEKSVSQFPSDYLKSRHQKEMSAKFPITPNLKWNEYKGHSFLVLNQSELILRVALFEAFLKDILQYALFEKPKILASQKPNRSIPLKDIFRKGFEQFKANEINRQVREVDRLDIKQRAKFFARRLKLPWGNDSDIARVHELVELRHDLIHQDTTVSICPKDIQDTRRLLFSIPRNCFERAVKLFPNISENSHLIVFSREYFRLEDVNSKNLTFTPAIVMLRSLLGSNTNSVVLGGNNSVLPSGGRVTVPLKPPY